MIEKICQMRKSMAQSDAQRDAGLQIPEGLTLCADIAYGDDHLQALDVYYPEGTAAPLPTIISIHGGGWVYADKELYAHYCMRLAKRGFTVVNFSYRLAPEHQYPAALEDCCKVLHWVNDHAQEYYIDKNNLFTVGDSAGGQLAFQVLTMLTNPRFADLFPFRCPEGMRIRAGGMNCGCYFMPVSRLLPPKRLGDMMHAYIPEDYIPLLPQFKPEKYITKDYPPCFVMSAQHDFLKFMAPKLNRLLKKRGVESVLKIYGAKEEKDIGHVFHLNCKLPLADICNDEQCDFFRKHIV